MCRHDGTVKIPFSLSLAPPCWRGFLLPSFTRSTLTLELIVGGARILFAKYLLTFYMVSRMIFP